MANIDTPGGNNQPTTASFDGNHVYASTGTFTVIVRVADDDMTGNFSGPASDANFVEQTFLVEVESAGPQTFVVDTLEDEDDTDFSPGDLSLREAIRLANENVGQADTITFAAALTAGGPAAITLSLEQLLITDTVTITGPRANLLTVDASGNDPTPASTLSDGNNLNDFDGTRVMEINDDTSGPAISVSISGLTFTGGDSSDDGGGIYNRENLTLTDCIITGNVAFGGGGIANYGRVEMSGTIVSNNAARVAGGGIANESSYLRIVNSTITGNTSNTSGGGVYNNNGEMILERSTVSNNRAIIPGSGAGAGLLRPRRTRPHRRKTVRRWKETWPGALSPYPAAAACSARAGRSPSILPRSETIKPITAAGSTGASR